MRTKHLPIAQPCHESWDAMDLVERGRFCQVCVKQVYDLSSMTEGEARGLLQEVEGSRICVRYRYGDDGLIRFAPPAPAAADTCSATPRRLAWAGAAMMAVAMAACTPHERADVTPRAAVEATIERTVAMGEPEPPEVVAPVETVRQAKGEIIAIEPPEPEHVLQGDMPAPMPARETKGDTIFEPAPEPRLLDVLGRTAAEPSVAEPCDPAPPKR